MYENGKRVNNYSKKRLHKQKMKNHFAKIWFWGSAEMSYNTIERFYNRRFPGESIDYWKRWYFSGKRRLAKDNTNRKLRQLGREHCQKAKIADIEEMARLPQGSEYQKYFDYGWEVW